MGERGDKKEKIILYSLLLQGRTNVYSSDGNNGGPLQSTLQSTVTMVNPTMVKVLRETRWVQLEEKTIHAYGLGLSLTFLNYGRSVKVFYFILLLLSKVASGS